MRFIGLYIKNNWHRRKAGVLIPLFSFFLSALLICITVFYLTLEKNIQQDGIGCPGLDARITLDAADAPAVEAVFADADWLQLCTRLEFTDLMPLYCEKIAAYEDRRGLSGLQLAADIHGARKHLHAGTDGRSAAGNGLNSTSVQNARH